MGPDISRSFLEIPSKSPFTESFNFFLTSVVTESLWDEGRLQVAAQLLGSSWEHSQTEDVQTTKMTVPGFGFTVAVCKPTQPCPWTKGSIEQESRILMPAVPQQQIKIMTYFWCLYTIQHNRKSNQTCWRVPPQFRRLQRQKHLSLHRGTPAAPGAHCLPGSAALSHRGRCLKTSQA